MIKKTTVAASIAFVAFCGAPLSTAYAGNAEFCRDYAHVAVNQAEECFASAACKSQDKGDGVWSTDFQHHYDWCVGVSYREAGLGRDQRTAILARYR